MFSPNINWEPLQRLPRPSEEIRESLARHTCWIVGFSGGADSVCSLLFALKTQEDFPAKRKLILYYLDHNENKGLLKASQRHSVLNYWLSEASKIHNLEVVFEKKTRNVQKIAQRLGKSFEYAGGMLRKKHLRILAFREENPAIILGHNLSDWYETLIMRLNRGVSPFSIYPFDLIENQNEVYFRPLALLSRDEIRKACENIPYWDDPENESENNLRAKIRNTVPVYNAKGLETSATEFLASKREKAAREKMLRAQIRSVADGREYRIEASVFDGLSLKEKEEITVLALQSLGFGPMSASIRKRFLPPFSYKMFFIEYENWSNEHFVVFRRGRKTLKTSEPAASEDVKTVCGDQITKRYFIQLAYGKKSATKIFSEKGLSARQRHNLKVSVMPGTNEIVYIPMRVYGLKDYSSTV